MTSAYTTPPRPRGLARASSASPSTSRSHSRQNILASPTSPPSSSSASGTASAALTTPLSPSSPTITISNVTATATATPREGPSNDGGHGGHGGGRRAMIRRSPSDPAHHYQSASSSGSVAMGARTGSASAHEGRTRSDTGSSRAALIHAPSASASATASTGQLQGHGSQRGHHYRRHAASQPPPLSLSASHFPHPFPQAQGHIRAGETASSSANASAGAGAVHHSLPLPLSPQQPIYVLSADGSSLFLLDPSKPPMEEQPPAYHSLNVQTRPASALGHSHPGSGGADTVEDVFTVAAPEGGVDVPAEEHQMLVSGHRARASTTSALRIRTHPSDVALPSSGARVQRAHAQTMSAHDRAQTGLWCLDQHGNRGGNGSSSSVRGAGLPGRNRSSASLQHVPHHASSSAPPERPRHTHHTSSPPQTLRTVRNGQMQGYETSSSSVRARAHSSASVNNNAQLARYGSRNRGQGQGHAQYGSIGGHIIPAASTGVGGAGAAAAETETTPLLGQARTRPRTMRGLTREVWCGALDPGEEEILARARLSSVEEAAEAEGDIVDFVRAQEAARKVNSWRAGWRRFWRPVGRKEYWRAMLHLVLLNFPFALFVWPPLLVGTLAGTALLITLPIGAAVWWLTLIIARGAARLEIRMQTHHHAPLSSRLPSPVYHPIFHRIKDIIPTSVSTADFAPALTRSASHVGVGYRSAPVSPISPALITLPASGSEGYFGRSVGQDTDEMGAVGGTGGEIVAEVQWEKRFVKCSYAMCQGSSCPSGDANLFFSVNTIPRHMARQMEGVWRQAMRTSRGSLGRRSKTMEELTIQFCDHYSYSALSYFLLVKPLITLLSTILVIALLPVAFATVAGLPVYMRALRRWGKWQAGVAMENL